MGHLLDGYQRNQRGGVTIRTFDSDRFPGPSEGWYDSPSKVPFNPGQKAEPLKPEVKASQPEATISANLGTHEVRPLGAPGKPGWPKGKSRRQS